MDKKVIEWIFGKVTFCKWQLFGLVLLNIFLSVFSVVLALFTKTIIDNGVSGDANGILISSALLITALIIYFSVQIFTQFLQEKVRNKTELEFKSSLFSNIITKDYDQVSKYHSGDLLTRIFSDVSVVTEGILTIIPVSSSMITGLIAAFLVLSVIDIKFLIIFVICGVLVLVLSRFLRKYIKSLHLKMQNEQGKVRSFMQDAITNLLAVITNDTNNNTQVKADNLQNKFFKARFKKRKASVLAGNGVDLMFDLGYIYALIWGAVNIAGGRITYGTVAAVLQLVSKVQEPFASLSSILPQIYSVIASAERIMEIENLSGTELSYAKDCNEIYDKMESIEFENVSFSYDNEQVLENAKVSIPKGKFVTFIGTSGIGKSTILKLLLGAYKDYSGNILVKTKTGNLLVNSSTRPLFSYVPQGNLLFAGTLKENLCFMSGNDNDEEIKRALSLACCDEFVELLPEKENTLIGEQGAGLSEGQVQRLAIARAILKNAPIILLDEATSALDEETELKVLNNLKSIENITVISISHKKASLDLSDKCFKVLNKKIINSNPTL